MSSSLKRRIKVESSSSLWRVFRTVNHGDDPDDHDDDQDDNDDDQDDHDDHDDNQGEVELSSSL